MAQSDYKRRKRRASDTIAQATRIIRTSYPEKRAIISLKRDKKISLSPRYLVRGLPSPQYIFFLSLGDYASHQSFMCVLGICWANAVFVEGRGVTVARTGH